MWTLQSVSFVDRSRRDLPFPYGFTAQLWANTYKDDATGYTKFGARYYAPGIGRFSQPDPSWQEANRYLYAAANPCNFTDPTGLYSVGEGIRDCAMGAARSAAIAVGLAGPTAGTSLVGAIGAGCLLNVGAGVIADLATNDAVAEERVNKGG